MENAFAWLGDIIQWIGKLFPRLMIVRSTHAGVRFKHGKNPKPIYPGLCVYWPLVTEVEVIPVARQTHNLPSQSLLTKDGKKVVVGGVVVYSIKDIVATLSKNWDVADTINDITMCAITHVITQHQFQYLVDHITDAVQAELTRETRRKLSAYGVRVYRTALTDFSTALVIKTMGGGGDRLTPIAPHNLE